MGNPHEQGSLPLWLRLVHRPRPSRSSGVHGRRPASPCPRLRHRRAPPRSRTLSGNASRGHRLQRDQRGAVPDTIWTASPGTRSALERLAPRTGDELRAPPFPRRPGYSPVDHDLGSADRVGRRPRREWRLCKHGRLSHRVSGLGSVAARRDHRYGQPHALQTRARAGGEDAIRRLATVSRHHCARQRPRRRARHRRLSQFHRGNAAAGPPHTRCERRRHHLLRHGRHEAMVDPRQQHQQCRERQSIRASSGRRFYPETAQRRVFRRAAYEHRHRWPDSVRANGSATIRRNLRAAAQSG